MEKVVIGLTGATGAMGSEAFRQLLEIDAPLYIKLLIRNPRRLSRALRSLIRKQKTRVEVIVASITDKDAVRAFVTGCDYVVHCAALIPPRADHNDAETMATNYTGTQNIIDAIDETHQQSSTRLVHISTVAVYGHRDWKHPWARMGDPVLISAYDYYGASKALGERAVLESDIENWVVLRQTGTLHKKFMTNNLNDGLMFHTVWNGPLEWVTDTDSGRLIQHLIEKELRGELNGFWKNDYNICGGTGCRETGYDTFKAGFALMGATPEQFFRPHWNIPRNFHGVWYTDSDELNGWLDYQREDIATFWKQMQKRCWYYKGGKIVPAALLRKIVIERLLSNSNAPLKWVRSNDTGRIQAFFESKEKFDAIPTEWEHYPLLIHNRTETGMIDYGALLQSGDNPLYVLDHGYDESKPTTELSLADMQQAAQFRGGTCTSTAMTTGDLFTPLAWKCHNGHEFTARPFTIIRAGYWCPHCCMPPRWTYDQEVPHIPFYAQVYYDTHSVEESNRSYPLSEGDR